MPINESITYLSGDDNELERAFLFIADLLSARLDLDGYLNEVVSSRGLQLTPSTLLMLLLPLAELDQERRSGRILEQVEQLNTARDSISQIIEEMKDHPAQYDLEHIQEFNSPESRRSCISLIRSLWSRFCNIPPICDDGPED